MTDDERADLAAKAQAAKEAGYLRNAITTQWSVTDAAYIAAATPGTILGLIEERDAFAAECERRAGYEPAYHQLAEARAEIEAARGAEAQFGQPDEYLERRIH